MTDYDYDELDGCETNMNDPDKITEDSDVDALVMFADVWDDPEATERRRVELVEWSSADV